MFEQWTGVEVELEQVDLRIGGGRSSVGAADIFQRPVVLHKLRGGQTRASLGGFERIAQITGAVNQADLGGAPARDNAAVRDPLKISGRQVRATFGNDRDEVVVELINKSLQQSAVLRRHGLKRRARRLVRPRRNRIGLDPDSAHAFGEVEGLYDDADGPGDRRGMSDDLIAGTRDVVPAGRGQVTHQHDDRLLCRPLEVLNLAVDDIAGGDGPAGRVDAQDDRLDLGVFGSLMQRLDEPADRILAFPEQAGAVSVGDHARDLNQRNLVRGLGPRVFKHDGLSQTVHGGHDINDQPHAPAAAEIRHQTEQNQYSNAHRGELPLSAAPNAPLRHILWAL